MNLDELVGNIRRVSSDAAVQKLADYIQQWKIDEQNAVNLKNNVERYFGYCWITEQADYDKVYGMWSNFRISAIDRIGGMTMNEKLYCFGLLDLFDKASDNKAQGKIYAKLMGKR